MPGSSFAPRSAQDFVKLRKSKLKIGMMCTIAPNQLVELIGSLHTRYPGLELELIDASARQLDARLLEGDLEVAIYCLPGEKPDERLHVLPLFREQMMIVVHPAHPLSMHNTIRLPDLEDQPYLNRVNCEFYGCSLFDGCSAWNMVYRSERDDWILAMIASGLGFGFMPENCISHPRPRAGALTGARPDVHGVSVQLCTDAPQPLLHSTCWAAFKPFSNDDKAATPD